MDTTRIITLKRALDDFPFWGIAPPLDIKSLHSGLTNRSYLLVTAKGDYILRLNNSNAYRLGISRRNEQRVLEAIEGEDFAPHTVYICPSYSYILTARIQGESFLDKAPSAKELEELKAIISYYQQELDLNLTTISYRDQLLAYYTTALECNAVDEPTAEQWQSFQAELEAFEANQPPAILCHGDLSPANIIRSNTGLKLIDWEFSNAGHPQLDLMAAKLIEANTPELKRLNNIIYWLDRLWMTIIPYYPKAPEEDGQQYLPKDLYHFYD